VAGQARRLLDAERPAGPLDPVGGSGETGARVVTGGPGRALAS